MKKYWVLFSFIIFCSCGKSFLDSPAKSGASNVVRQAYVTNLQSCSDVLNGVYIDLSTSVFHGYNYLYADLVADNMKPNGSTLNPHYSWNQVADASNQGTPSSTTTNMNGLWLPCYKVIRTCSYLLENIDRFRVEDPVKADNLKGQAYAVRALAHFYLVNVFAQPFGFTADASHPGVPYVTVSDYTQPLVRNTVAETYAGMLNDLNNAIALLQPVSATNKVFFNREAAKALIARVYLYKGDYTAARGIARDVSLAVPIMTAANYPSKLYTTNETEALFQLPPSTSGVNSSTANTFFEGYYLRSPNLTFLATKDVATILTERATDSRKAWVTVSGTNYNITKFPSGAVTGITNVNGAYYQTILRSSEMYLTAAEAYARTGNEDSSRYFLNAIRQRADATTPTLTTMGQALIDSVLKERRKELCFEGLRMFDLQRLKLGVHRTDANSATVKDLNFPNSKSIAPIHSNDVDVAGVSQNLDY